MQKQIQQDPKRTAQKFTKTELQISRKRIRSERRRKNKNRERLPKRNYLTNAEIVGRAIDLLVMAKEMMIVIRTRETLGGGGGEAIGE